MQLQLPPPRLRHGALAALVLIVLAVASPAAGARPDAGHGTRRVEFTQSPPVLVGGDFGCDPSDATRCVGTFRNQRTLSGDFTGTTHQSGAAMSTDYQGLAPRRDLSRRSHRAVHRLRRGM